MSYLVLARKFRPQTFASVVGQEHITRALANAIVRNKIAHALLFTGPRGVGKTSAARVMARALNCTGRPLTVDVAKLGEEKARELIEPCGTCSNCVEIARSNSIAVWEIDGASNNSVENVRELIDSLRSLPPPGSNYKIYIIDEVHMLSTAAFNALLKSLEEPPPNTIFIFATTEPHKIPETVISRCQRHDFRKLPLELIADQLREVAKAEGMKAEDAVFDFVARKADGGMRDAQSLLDRLNAFSSEKITLTEALRIFGDVGSEFFFRLSKTVLARDPRGAIELLDQAFQQSVDIRSFTSGLLLHFRALLLVKLTMANERVVNDANGEKLCRMLEISKADLAEYIAQGAESSAFDLQRLFDAVQQTADLALTSNYPRYVLEAGVAKLASLSDLRPVAEIVAKLEQGLSGSLSSGGGSGRGGQRIASPSSSAEQKNRGASNGASLPTEARKDAQSVITAASVELEERQEFQPVWNDFVQHVRGRSEPVLAAHLRRVAPVSFISGRLELRATPFDLGTLREPGTLSSLRACLFSYSRVEHWEIIIEPGEPAEHTAKIGEQPAGSIAMIEVQREREKAAQVTEEAKSDPLIQQALSMFQGSRIEKVSVLKR